MPGVGGGDQADGLGQNAITLKITGLGDRRGQGVDDEVVALGRGAEDLQRFCALEAGQLRRLEEGAGPVGLLDQGLDRRRRLGRQAEADVDGVFKSRLETLVAEAQRRLEGRDHVADDVFGGVVQQGGQTPLGLQPRPDVSGDLLDHAGVLGHREGVLADRLPVPAGDPGQAVGDVLDLDVEGRRIEQVEATARQHALPGAGRNRGSGLGGGR